MANGNSRYVPPPTDAQVVLTGWQGQPANPMWFCTEEEANACLARLKAKRVVPPSTVLVDEPSALGPVLYGRDGRHVWIMEWTSKIPDIGKVNFSQPVGPVLYWENVYPSMEIFADPAGSGLNIRNPIG